jgi:hypothetical protein
VRGWLLLVVALPVVSCGGGDGGAPPPPSSGPSRSYVMGFSAIPPRSTRARRTRDRSLGAAGGRRAHPAEPPWAGPGRRDPDALVRANPLEIANYMRGKRLRIISSIDPTNGLDRGAESAAPRPRGAACRA